MPNSQSNIGISNLSMHTLRTVHRRAKVLAIRTNLSLPVVVTWWLSKMPASVSASQHVEMLVTQVEMAASQEQEPCQRGEAHDIGPPEEEQNPDDVQHWIRNEIRRTCESVQLSEGGLDLCGEAARAMDRHADATEPGD